MTEKLITFMTGKRLGEITFDGISDRYGLQYASSWTADGGFYVSPHLTFNQSPDDAVKRFIANLLPEGKWLEELSISAQISKANIFGLIATIGSETTGALTFRSAGTEENLATTFRPIAPIELRERIQARNEKSITLWDGKQRLSTAGVQDKLPVIIMPDGTMGLGEGDLASTHILKFDTKQNLQLVVNEYVCMTLARLVGLSVADVSMERIGDLVLVVKRFDREWAGERFVNRRHIIDGCQMLDLPPTYKYERPFGKSGNAGGLRTGASLRLLFNACGSCRVPALAIKETMNWALFQLLIGNSDAHGKNISYFVGPGGIELAPAYDLVCLDVYGDQYERDLAMAIGDTFNPEEVQAWQIAEMCEECKIPQRQTGLTLTSLCERTLKSLERIKLPDILTQEESGFGTHLINIIAERTHEYKEYARLLPGIKL